MGTRHPLFIEGRRGSDTNKKVSVTIRGTETLSLDVFCKVCLTLPGNSFTLEHPLGSEMKSHYNCLELVSGRILGAVLKPHTGFPSCTLDTRARPPLHGRGDAPGFV